MQVLRLHAAQLMACHQEKYIAEIFDQASLA